MGGETHDLWRSGMLSQPLHHMAEGVCYKRRCGCLESYLLLFKILSSLLSSFLLASLPPSLSSSNLYPPFLSLSPTVLLYPPSTFPLCMYTPSWDLPTLLPPFLPPFFSPSLPPSLLLSLSPSPHSPDALRRTTGGTGIGG